MVWPESYEIRLTRKTSVEREIRYYTDACTIVHNKNWISNVYPFKLETFSDC